MKFCTTEGCGNALFGRGMCRRHYDESRRCSVEGCGRTVAGQTLCCGHLRQKRLGVELRPLRPYKQRRAKEERPPLPDDDDGPVPVVGDFREVPPYVPQGWRKLAGGLS